VGEQRRAEASERTTEQERRVKAIQKLDRLDEAADRPHQLQGSQRDAIAKIAAIAGAARDLRAASSDYLLRLPQTTVFGPTLSQFSVPSDCAFRSRKPFPQTTVFAHVCGLSQTTSFV
jgi:hypothetical protein